MDASEEDFEVHFDERNGQLRLTCGGTLFRRIRDRILAEPDVTEVIGDKTADIRSIEIELM